VAAVLAFALGRLVAQAGDDGVSLAARTRVPVFACAPAWEFDGSWAERFESIASTDKWMYVPTVGGAHGSAMLRPDRNPEGHEATWTRVIEFLDTYAR
jgi:dienelactone hydrolase